MSESADHIRFVRGVHHRLVVVKSQSDCVGVQRHFFY